MILKRLPLFITGLLYGLIINCAVLGLIYGSIALLFGLAVTCISLWNSKKDLVLLGSLTIILALLGEVSSLNDLSQLTLPQIGQIAYNNLYSYGYNLLLIFGGTVLALSALAFTAGVTYGLIFGTWHCAMDFYNNGVRQGLTSPFRFLSTHLVNVLTGDKEPLKEYYESTEVGLYERRLAAEQAIMEQARFVHVALHSVPENKKGPIQRTQGGKKGAMKLPSLPPLPLVISREIALLSTEPNRCLLPESLHPSAMARRIENLSSGESKNENEVKDQLAKTAAGYFDDQQTMKIILKDGFFKGSAFLNPEPPLTRPSGTLSHKGRGTYG